MPKDYEQFDSGDAVCECSHFQSVHKARGEDDLIIEGHGACPYCECERFAWAAPAHPRWRKTEGDDDDGIRINPAAPGLDPFPIGEDED